jgi:hypothetical protein
MTLGTEEDTHLKEEALDRIKWRNRFGRGCGPVVWQSTNEWMMCIILGQLLIEITSMPSNVCLLHASSALYAATLIVSFRRNACHTCTCTLLRSNIIFCTKPGTLPSTLNQTNADPKGKWHRLSRKKTDQQTVHGSECAYIYDESQKQISDY